MYFFGGVFIKMSLEVALNSQHCGCLHRQNFFSLFFFFLNCMFQRAKGHQALGKTTQTPTHQLQHKSPCESLSKRAYDPAVLRPYFKNQRKRKKTCTPSEKKRRKKHLRELFCRGDDDDNT